MPTKRCNVSIRSQTLQSTASLIINWAWELWVGASTRASVSGKKLLTLLFAYCVVNQHPAFLKYLPQRLAPRYDSRELQRWEID